METASLDMDQNINLASWNRPRSTEELVDFISRRHAALTEDFDIDDNL